MTKSNLKSPVAEILQNHSKYPAFPVDEKHKNVNH